MRHSSLAELHIAAILLDVEPLLRHLLGAAVQLRLDPRIDGAQLRLRRVVAVELVVQPGVVGMQLLDLREAAMVATGWVGQS